MKSRTAMPQTAPVKLPVVLTSVGQKITRLALVTTFAALALAAIALLAYDARKYREDWVADLTTQADIVARSSSPALQFKDPGSAQATLGLLQSREDLLGAVIFNAEGKPFASASFAREDIAALPPQPPGWLGYRVEGGTIALVQPIVESGERIGTLYLRARYKLWDRVRDYVLILSGVMLGSLLFAFVLSTRLQRAITAPIIALTEATRRVLDRKDFSARVPKTTDDEIGVLVDVFNAMLTEVGERSAAVEASNRSLQQETEERRAAVAALREADRRKDEFLATLAHELRNPLAPMVNAVALLRVSGNDPEIAQKAREMLQRQLSQMVRLVDDLLDVARITTGKLALHCQAIELADVVRSAAEIVKPVIDARRHQLSITLPPEPVLLHADGTRLAQVFSNLLNNAAKYTDEGGHISLSARIEGSMVRLDVTDDGIGIPREVLPKVFEMFAQADHAIERKQTGLGVGLSLARRLVEMHGGRIEASSPGAGKGSTFTVWLPFMARPLPAGAVTDQALAPDSVRSSS